MTKETPRNSTDVPLPLCPFCEKEIEEIVARNTPFIAPLKTAGILKRKSCVVVSCPHCHKIIQIYDYFS